MLVIIIRNIGKLSKVVWWESATWLTCVNAKRERERICGLRIHVFKFNLLNSTTQTVRLHSSFCKLVSDSLLIMCMLLFWLMIVLVFLWIHMSIICFQLFFYKLSRIAYENNEAFIDMGDSFWIWCATIFHVWKSYLENESFATTMP